MNCNQIMFFTSENNYDSLTLGVYDEESLFIVSKIHISIREKIKELYKSRYGMNLNIGE